MVLVVRNLPANAGDIRDAGSIPGWRRSLGGRHATHSSILAWRIHMDRGAWQATAHGVAKSWTRLKRLSTLVKGEKTTFLILSYATYWVSFSYFRKGPFFGLACFANMPVESELERGARMKSVGILSPSYTLLYRHMHFLENQVRCVAHRRGGRRRAGG